MTDGPDLIERFNRGERLALSRIISSVENRRDGYEGLIDAIYPRSGNAWRIGVTGPPGAGKSTLVERLVQTVRSSERTVGVVAVDPTSPFSGGALLGDRVRMSSVQTDPGVFIRSMATRGSLGGLAGTTEEVATVLDAFGMDVVFLETVGVGQSELDIADQADVTIVVVVPESGDAVQTLKAGLMEIADILVVNKADREGADEMARALEDMVGLRSDGQHRPVVYRTVATDSTGVEELWNGIERLYEHRMNTGLLDEMRRGRIRTHLVKVIERRIRSFLWNSRGSTELIDRYVGMIEEERETPYTASRKILDELGVGW